VSGLPTPSFGPAASPADPGSAAVIPEIDAVTVPRRRVRRGGWSVVARTALRLGRTRIGLVIVTGVVLIALVGPAFAPYSPTELVAPPYAAASAKVPLGADSLGRDVLSRFLNGGRSILILAALATLLGVGLGTALGLAAGYLRGFWDSTIMRSLDVFLCFPSVVLALLLMAVSGPKLWLIVVAVAIAHAPQVARVMRGAAVQLTGREFVAYSETIGTSRRRILLQDLLPNVTAPLTVELGLRMTYSIGIVASLAFLGFGQQPPKADWGSMINENRGGLTIQPWGVMAPVIAIAVLTIGTNLVADGLGRAAAGIDRQVDPGDET
jgi:peptide/nickel transport system permease protein